MFENVKAHDIFPTPVWALDFKADFARDLNRRIMTEIERMLSPRPPIGVGGTWQTDQNLHTLPAFADLAAAIDKAARGALDFMKAEYSRFEITALWANINPKGGLNSAHSHPNNYLSGVYYVQVPKGSDKIVFLDPREQACTIMPPVKEYTAYNGNEVTFEIKAGRMILFPAWLRHGVPVNRSEEERVSMAFNIMFSTFTQEMSRPLWEGIAVDDGR